MTLTEGCYKSLHDTSNHVVKYNVLYLKLCYIAQKLPISIILEIVSQDHIEQHFALGPYRDAWPCMEQSDNVSLRFTN